MQETLRTAIALAHTCCKTLTSLSGSADFAPDSLINHKPNTHLIAGGGHQCETLQKAITLAKDLSFIIALKLAFGSAISAPDHNKS